MPDAASMISQQPASPQSAAIAPSPPEQEQPPVGEGSEASEQPCPLLKERYQMLHYLSRGSFGETFMARDTQLPGCPQCVVKRFNPLNITSEIALEEARQRFDQEAAVLHALGRHDQIPQLFAHFESDGDFYLVQEFIPGPSLQEILTQQPQWPVASVVQLLIQILEILTFVHGQGVIHRDIKPDNILHRQSDRRWVLIDFGAVKQLAAGTPTPDFGPHTLAIYSEGYTPSEQLEGCPCPASDLYALGMLALQCLSGHPPNTFKQTLREQGQTWLHSLVEVPELAAILEKMTHPHWPDRHQNAEAALRELQGLVPSLNPQSPRNLPTPSSPQAPRCQQRTPRSQKPKIETVIRPPVLPPETPKLTFPTAVLKPRRSPPGETPSPQPNESFGKGVPHFSPPNLNQTGLNQTEETPTPFWSKPPVQKVKGYLWGWCTAHNIHQWQDALALVLCLAVVLGVASTLSWWVVAAVSQPRSREAPPTQPATTASLLATLSGDAAMHQVAFAGDGKTIFSADADGTIQAWDIASQHPIQNLTHLGKVTTLATSLVGNQFASGDDYANIHLWDARTGKLLHTLRKHQAPILSMTLSPDGHTLVSSSDDQKLILWDLTTPRFKHRILKVSAPITATHISPDGNYLVGGSRDFTLKVWQISNGRLLQNLTGHSGAIQTVAISPNGAVVASGSADRTVCIWNLYTGQLITTLSEHYGAVTAIAFSPNGQMIASGSEDGTVRLWHIYSGNLIQKLSDFQGAILDLAISPDGQLLASSTATGTLHLWDISQAVQP